ncbi:MAG: hypothetical protein JWQ49_5197 [Edaphobacter sp.]|jgi:hypothetical protein|nr:hypothetical protein [Edaphobacter sp.]
MGPIEEERYEQQQKLAELDYHRGHLDGSSGEFFRPDETPAWKEGFKDSRDPGQTLGSSS